MRILTTLKCLLLALTVVVSFAACNGGDVSTQTPPSSQTGPAEGEPAIRKPQEDHAALEDNDHLFDYKSANWEGPEGYVIVVPHNNVSAKETAELLRSYYKDTFDISLEIKTDKTSAQTKEILIGKTSRPESNRDITEEKLSVSVQNGKLIFDGGHDITVDSAVKKFIRLAPEKNKAFTFEITTDFKSELEGDLAGYKYVWGDEFESNGLNSKNWDFAVNMTGSDTVELSTDKNVADVQDGRLKLHALSYFNNDREGTQFRVPASVVTQKKMNYVYGYAEVRSRVPYSQGCWPSFWTRSTDTLKGSWNEDYMLEVDIYEIFRTTQAHSTIHKWYTAEFDYNKRYDSSKENGIERNTNTANSNVSTNPNKFTFDSSPNLIYEYHTYGYEWTPTEMKMSVDGEVFCTFDITKSFDSHNDQASFHDPQYLIFNNHLFHPEVSTACKSITTAPQSLPACHYVDYIRLYQKDGVGKLYIGK